MINTHFSLQYSHFSLQYMLTIVINTHFSPVQNLGIEENQEWYRGYQRIVFQVESEGADILESVLGLGGSTDFEPLRPLSCIGIYSETSNRGPSEFGTQLNIITQGNSYTKLHTTKKNGEIDKPP